MTTSKAVSIFKSERLRFGDQEHIEAAKCLERARLPQAQVEAIEQAAQARLPIGESADADCAA
jgi:hypothetical protein